MKINFVSLSFISSFLIIFALEAHAIVPFLDCTANEVPFSLNKTGEDFNEYVVAMGRRYIHLRQEHHTVDIGMSLEKALSPDLLQNLLITNPREGWHGPLKASSMLDDLLVECRGPADRFGKNFSLSLFGLSAMHDLTNHECWADAELVFQASGSKAGLLRVTLSHSLLISQNCPLPLSFQDTYRVKVQITKDGKILTGTSIDDAEAKVHLKLDENGNLLQLKTEIPAALTIKPVR